MKNGFLKSLSQAGSCSLLAILLVSGTVFAQENEMDLAAQEAALLAELKAGLSSSENIEVKNSFRQGSTVAQNNKPIKATDESRSSNPAEDDSYDTDQDNSARTTIKAAKSDHSFDQEAQIDTESQELRAALASNEGKVQQLMAKLKKQRNQLLLAEAEVARLSKILEKQRGSKLKQVTGYSVTPSKPPQDARLAAVTSIQAKRMTPDMTIATVNVKKANLRTGPGLNNSPLMTVSKGTRLAVETRKGEWYRIIAPTGARAWVSADVVNFGVNRVSEPTRTVRVKGYTDNAEEDAFKLINQIDR